MGRELQQPLGWVGRIGRSGKEMGFAVCNRSGMLWTEMSVSQDWRLAMSSVVAWGGPGDGGCRQDGSCKSQANHKQI